MPGAPDLEEAWIRAFLGEDGNLVGKDAEAALPPRMRLDRAYRP
jgi:hypothetical protein